MLQIIQALNVATACVLVRFCYQGRLYIWSVLTAALLLVYHCVTVSTSCNPTERNLMCLSRKTRRASHQSIASPPSSLDFRYRGRNTMLHQVVTIFVFVLQEAHPLNVAVIRFPENSCNTGLLNVPRSHVIQSGYCLMLHTTAFSYLTWIFVCPRVRIPYAGSTIPDKLSFILEQNVMQSVYPWLQPFTKWHMSGVISR
jgi:hypothetical protein